ncbi:MAG: DUF58 domain-containing protein [Myxococcales bacterium]|nr:DUF58 domain-containing protein [Myxococcales bacterium]
MSTQAGDRPSAPPTPVETPVTVRWIPGRRLALLAALALPAYLMGPYGVATGLVVDILLIVAAMLESRSLTARVPVAERRMEARLLLGVDNRVRVRLHNPSPRRLQVTVRDDTPAGFKVDEDELSTELAPYARTELEYQVAPDRRGRYAFGHLHLRVEGALSLGSVLATVELDEEVRVYPNLRGPKRYELALRLGALHSVGVRNIRRSGGGGEFEQMREYVPGDPFKDLDWKATAKRHRPITRVHGQERSQTVIVAIDAGRMMATRLDDITKLDHAINASLLLTYVALRGGDKVGLIVFAEGVLSFVPPRRGPSQYQRILESLYAVEASPTYVDFRRLTQFVRGRVPRRALLLLFSDLLDESQAVPLAEQAPLLGRKHLPLCVTMNDPVAEAMSEVHVERPEQAYRRAAAVDILAEREGVKGRLRKSGMGLVEAPAGELAVATVNRYLEIKSRAAL